MTNTTNRTEHPPASGHTGLRTGSLRNTELVAQGVSNIAPTAVIAFVLGSVFLTAGNAIWFAWTLATIVILITGYCVIQFSQRRATAGSLYTYAAQGAGPYAGYVAGVMFLVGSFGVAAGVLAALSKYATIFLGQVGWHVTGTLAYIIMSIIFAAATTGLTIFSVRAAVRVSIFIEVISLTIVLIVLITGLFTAAPHGIIDHQQLTLSGASAGGIGTGMVLAILGFVGFASSDALGREARNPYKAIPRAIMWPTLVIGLIYIFASYTQETILGSKLGTASDPLGDITKLAGFPNWFVPIVTIAFMCSFFAVIVAPLNVMGRVLYVMGAEGVFPSWLGHTGAKRLTPHRAILFAGCLMFVVDLILLLVGVEPLNLFIAWEDYGSFGFMVAFIVVAIASVLFLRKLHVRNLWIIPAAVIVVGTMLYVFFTSARSIPAAPIGPFFYAFYGTLAAALAWLLYLHIARRETVAHIASFEVSALTGTSLNSEPSVVGRNIGDNSDGTVSS